MASAATSNPKKRAAPDELPADATPPPFKVSMETALAQLATASDRDRADGIERLLHITLDYVSKTDAIYKRALAVLENLTNKTPAASTPAATTAEPTVPTVNLPPLSKNLDASCRLCRGSCIDALFKCRTCALAPRITPSAKVCKLCRRDTDRINSFGECDNCADVQDYP